MDKKNRPRAGGKLWLLELKHRTFPRHGPAEAKPPICRKFLAPSPRPISFNIMYSNKL